MEVLVVLNDWSAPGGVSRVGNMIAAGLSSDARVSRVGIWGSQADKVLLPNIGQHESALNLVSPSRRFRANPLHKRKAGRLLRKVVGNPANTVIIAFDVAAAQVVAAAQLDVALTICQFHNSFNALAGSRDMPRFRRAAKSFDAVLMLSAADQMAMSAILNRPVSVIPNPVDLDLFSDRQSHTTTDFKRIVAIGRLSRVKNFDVLIDAWALTAARQDGWRLDVVGDGPEYANLTAKIGVLGLRESVEIHGAKSDIQDLLRSSDLLALTSKFEGLPLVITEAFSQGVPVVAVNCSPGVEQLITDSGAGWLVDVNTPATFAKALDLAVNRKDIRREMGSNGVTFAGARTVEAISARWLEFIGERAQIESQHVDCAE